MGKTQAICPVVSDAIGRKASRPARPWLETALCVLGSLGTIVFPGLGTMAMTYGAWLLAREQEGRKALAIVACLLPGVALSFVSWAYYGSLMLPCILCALALALLLPGHIRITQVTAVILCTAAIVVAAETSFAVQMGFSGMSAYVSAQMDEVREMTLAQLSGNGSTVAITASLDQTLGLMEKLWPLMYVAQASFWTIMGLLGLAIARRDTYQRVYGAFVKFDLPLWTVVALALALVCIAASSMGALQGVPVEAIGLNVLMFVRVYFLLQGFAAALNLMDRRRWGMFTRVLFLTVMLLVELGFFAVSVFGVIDVWANFRKLDRRDRKSSEARQTGE